MSEVGEHVILIHGSFHGGWCWDALYRVLPDNWRVSAPDLGHGGFPDHVKVLSAIIAAAPTRPVLVLHSYAGMIAADAIAMAGIAPKRAIFLDAFLPDRGENAFALLGEAGEAMAAAPGEMMQPPPAALFGIDDPELQGWVDSRLTSFPKSTHQTVTDQSALGIGTGAFVRCTRSPFFAEAERRAVAAGWPVRRIDACHDAMITDPALVASAIMELV